MSQKKRPFHKSVFCMVENDLTLFFKISKQTSPPEFFCRIIEILFEKRLNYGENTCFLRWWKNRIQSCYQNVKHREHFFEIFWRKNILFFFFKKCDSKRYIFPIVETILKWKQYFEHNSNIVSVKKVGKNGRDVLRFGNNFRYDFFMISKNMWFLHSSDGCHKIFQWYNKKI